MILSSSPLIIGGDAVPDVASCVGVWPIAGATAPRVNPPARAAPPFRSSLRSKRFEPIGLSPYTDEATGDPVVGSIRPSRRPIHGRSKRQGRLSLGGCLRRRAEPTDGVFERLL